MNTTRPPVVVIMGHVDHGKSTLLDYIRKTNIVATEAGGITQHLSAYEVTQKDEHGTARTITFLDTPGHAAFSGMRERGASVADIAILVVSAEDGVKAQTKEALATIIASGIPYIVAINKIDRPGANIDQTIAGLIESGVYLEGYGGDIPYVKISAKTGAGIDELLGTILLVADLHAFTGNTAVLAEGRIIEAHLDSKRGAQATLIIKEGTVQRGVFFVAGDAYASTKMMEDFLGKPVVTATLSNPLRVIGWNKVPAVGTPFVCVATKKEAEALIEKYSATQEHVATERTADNHCAIPLIIKADVFGTVEAIEKEVTQLAQENVSYKIISKGVGPIGEADMKLAQGDPATILVGFNVKLDATARDMQEQYGITVQTFNVIYTLTEWLQSMMEERRPKVQTIEVTGSLKVLKTFSATKERQVIGGKVIGGRITEGSLVRIMRREFEIGKGKIIGIETNKVKTKEVAENTECGVLVESRTEIAPNDILENFSVVTK